MGLGNLTVSHSLRDRRLLGGILVVFVALSVTYNVMLPLFEAPDEADHYRFARWLASGQTYPDLVKDAGAAGHEIWQTPLYYYFISPVVGLMNGDEPHETAPLNPGYQAGYSSLVHVHTAVETFPYAGTSAAVHLARLITTVFGVGVILAAYGLAQIVWPQAAWIAAALVAFNPQFVFMSSVINNDVPAACLAGLTIWWLFRGFQRTTRGARWSIALGVLWGLAILTKLNNVVLAVPIGLGLLIMHWPLRQQWRRVLIDGLLIAAPAALVAGWWFVLNQVRYQDWLAWQPMLNMVGGLQRTQSLSWDQALAYSTGLLTSFWLNIGYGFRGPAGFYVIFNLVLWAAALGLGLWLWTQLRQRSIRVLLQAGILGVWVITAFISLLQWMRLLTATDQGRLLFPVLSGLAVLLAIGLTRLTWRRFSLAPVAIGGLLVCALLTPMVVMAPAYAQPVPLSLDVDVPNPHTLEFGGEIGLRGFELSPDRLDTPGVLNVDLYWAGVTRPAANYIARITLVDQNGRTPAILDRMPFEGRYPATSWSPQQLMRDQYGIVVPAQAQAQLVTAYLSLYPIGQGSELSEAVESGEALGQYIELGKVKLRGPVTVLQPQQRTEARLGDDLELLGFDAPAHLEVSVPVSLTLYWRALRQPADDFTVFVHLLGPAGDVVAQADSQPRANQYPTSIWDAGEQISDMYEVALPADLPSGDYRLQVGMYRLVTGERLLAKQADGESWPDNAILLNTYHVP
jgi:hypothetical protein